MRCKECGIEVDNEKAFCPICGAPMKVTADYEYIQAEIANKVDRFFNDDAEDNKKDLDSEEPELDLFIDSKKEETPVNDKRRYSKPEEYDDFAKTRNIFGSDSIFDDEILEDTDYDEPEYEPEYEEEIPDRREAERRRPERRPERRPQRRPRRDEDYYEPKSHTGAKVLTVLIIFVIIAACAIGVMAITGTFRPGGNTDAPVQTTASLTSNLVAGETYADPVEVTLTCATEGNVFYTLDGTEPTFNARMYTGPFVITSSDAGANYPTVNLRAAAYGTDSQKSGDLNITFDFEYDASKAPVIETEPVRTSLEAPQISPASGSYTGDNAITVVSPDGADIYYTYDGSTPNKSSQRYSGAVKMVPGSSIFQAVCIDGDIVSPVVSANFELDYDFPTSASGAVNAVLNELIWDGYVADYDGNTWDGGHAEFKHLGVYDIDGYTYYIIEADIFGSDGIIQDTLILGVGVNYGSVYWASRSGDSFTINN